LLKSDVSITKSDVSVSMFRLDHERGGDTGAKIAVVSHFCINTIYFTKTGSGQTYVGKALKKEMLFAGRCRGNDRICPG
jgi:hypothetical protein